MKKQFKFVVKTESLIITTEALDAPCTVKEYDIVFNKVFKIANEYSKTHGIKAKISIETI